MKLTEQGLKLRSKRPDCVFYLYYIHNKYYRLVDSITSLLLVDISTRCI
jgi:hypothetical protein